MDTWNRNMTSACRKVMALCSICYCYISTFIFHFIVFIRVHWYLIQFEFWKKKFIIISKAFQPLVCGEYACECQIGDGLRITMDTNMHVVQSMRCFNFEMDSKEIATILDIESWMRSCFGVDVCLCVYCVCSQSLEWKLFRRNIKMPSKLWIYDDVWKHTAHTHTHPHISAITPISILVKEPIKRILRTFYSINNATASSCVHRMHTNVCKMYFYVIKLLPLYVEDDNFPIRPFGSMQ